MSTEQQEQQQRAFRGVWIPADIWLNSDLSIQEKVMLVEIDSLCVGERGCYKRNKAFADFFQLSESRVSEVIKSLEQKGMIRIEYQRSGKQIIERNIFMVSAFEKPNTPLRKVEEPSSENRRPSSENAEESNTTEKYKENNTEKTYGATAPDVFAESKHSSNVKEVYTYWQKIMDKQRSKLDNNRRGLIERALKNYSVDDLKQAIDGCAASPFHMGQNRDKKKYNGLELILRNSEKIEGFRDNCGKHIADAHGGFKPGDYDDVGFMSDGAREALGL